MNGSRTIDNLDLDGALITDSSSTTILRVDGQLDWTGTGRFGGAMTVRADGGITISGSGTKILGEFNGGAATLTNNSTATLSGGTLNVQGAFGGSLPGSELINNGAWNFTSSSSIFGTGSGSSSGVFTNNGTISKTGSANASINVILDNNGSVSVTGGKLTIANGEDVNADYVANGSGHLVFNGQREIGPGNSITGSGTVQFSGGGVIDGATYNVTGTTLLTGNGVDFDSDESISTLHLDASSADLGGDGDLSIGTLIWEHGDINSDAEITVGTIDMSSGSIFRNLGDSQNTTSLIVTGNTDHSQGDLRINRRGTTFTNRGTYTIENGSDIDDGSSGGGAHGRFINEGTFEMNENGSAEIRAFFDNDDGNVNVLRGNLEIREGGIDDGAAYFVDRNGELEFDGGTREIDTFSTITGDGDVTFRSGTITLDGSGYDITSPGETTISGATVNFNGTSSSKDTWRLGMTGGTRAGNSFLLASSTFTWSGGTLASGAETSANGVILSGASAKNLGSGGSGAGAILTNYGSGSLSGGGNLVIAGSSSAAAGSELYNTGTFEITDDSDITGVSNGGTDGSVFNGTTGVFTKSGVGTTSTIGVPFTNQNTVNANSGTLSFLAGFTQTSGVLNLAGGTVTSSSALDLQGGSLTGNGTITGDTAAAGIVAPGASAGFIDFDGGLTLTPSSDLLMEIGGIVRGTDYDALDVSGTLTLDGDLVVTFISSYIPTAGESFNLWDAAVTSGSFSTVSLPTLSDGLTWDTSQLASGGILSVSGGGYADYADFETDFGLVEGPTGDDDKDGLSNFLEYLLGSLPNDVSSAPRMMIERDGTTTTVTITVPETLPPGVSQYIESSAMLDPDPENWDPVAERPAGGAWGAPAMVSPPSDGFIEVSVEITESIPENFYRFGGAEVSP